MSPAVRATANDLCVGGLSFGTDYTITLLKGLPSQTGTRTDKDETVQVSLGDRPPLVAVSGDGFILPRATSNGIAIQTVNVDHVKVHVLRMSDRLLPSRVGRRDDYGGLSVLSGETTSRYQIRSLLQSSASLVWSGTMDVEADHNRTVETAFPLSDIVKSGKPGVYMIVAEKADGATPETFFTKIPKPDDSDSSDDLYVDLATHWVISTDMALTTMRGDDGLHVSARSLASAGPVSGIKLSLISYGQDVLATATTDSNGRAAFASGLMLGNGASGPSTLVAYAADGDFTILDLNRPAFDLSDRGVTGRPPAGPVEAFVYPERGIYRPGETVEAMVLLRDRVGKSIDDMPLTLILRRPDGVEAKRFTLKTQTAGGFHQSVELSKTASRGMWSVEALVDASGTPVGRAQFDVQDFVPQQLKVTLKSSSPALKPGEPIAAALDGQFLYGAPAAQLKSEATLKITRDPSPVADAKGYSFGLVDEKIEDALQTLDPPVADADGHVRITDVFQAPKPSKTPLKGVLTAGLFEPSGRVVEDTVELPIRTQPVLLGVKPRFADNRTQESSTAVFDVRAFDADGHGIARTGLRWRLVREDHVYDWFKTGSNWQWHYHVVDVPIASGAIDVAAAAAAALSQPVEWGYFRLILDDPQSQAATSIRFSAGWEQTTDAADTPDKVDVSVEKAVVAPGDKLHVRIQGPFAGKAEVAIAGSRIFETRSIDVPKDGATVDINASADWGAGAYVLVSMYRPLNEGRARDPVRAIGLAWVGIDAAPRTLAVAINAPSKVTPQQKIEVPITVKGAGPNTYVTLAAVDEGILQLTRFATPDPVGFLFGKRQLGVDIRDDYGRLLDGSAAAGPIHQGGDEGIGGQALPVVSKRTVALFSGPVALDSNGTAHVTLDIPDFEGQLRLMAIAYNHDAVGQSEATLIVRDPVVADLALPRFLAPGDSAHLALLLHNLDGVAGDYHLKLASEGAATVSADHPLDYTLAVGEQKMDGISIAGTDDGIATIKADFTGPNNYAVHREWQIAVRAAHYPIALEDTATQAPGQDYRIDPKMVSAFVPGSVTVSLGYSGFAGIDVPSLLQSLYRYPYGCTEQLVSTAFPLLYFGDPSLLGRVPQDAGVKPRVQQAIDTILDRQDAAGQFGLWRSGDSEASPWLNVYVLDFMLHAQQAGFTVSPAAIQRSYVWLQQALRQIDQANSGYYAQAADATRTYGEYVLARAGRADIGTIRRIHDTARTASRLEPQRTLIRWRDKGDNVLAQPLSLGQLAGALSLMGDRARGKEAFTMAIAALDVVRYPRWWFDLAYYSKARDIAGLIAVAAEIGDDQTAATLTQRLSDMKLSADKLNTQDKAWLLAAAHALNTDNSGRSIAINGKAVVDLKLPLALAPTIDEITAGYSVSNKGERDLYRTLVVQGAPKEAPSAIEAGYTLKKEYFALDGTPVDPTHLKQNDRMIVSLSGHNDDKNSHRTVLVDMLPAGWEIEAPIAVKDNGYDFLGPLSQTRLREARDDRYVAAFDLGDGLELSERYTEVNDADAHLAKNEFHMAYLVRAITPGNFVLPEAVVEDMYRPGMMARTAAGQAVVELK